MAKLSSAPYRTLASLSLTHPPRRLIPVSASCRSLTTSSHRRKPSNVGNVGLAEKDTIIGQQAHEPLTIEGIKARRVKAGKLVAPTASYSDSDMFKSPVCDILTLCHAMSNLKDTLSLTVANSKHTTNPKLDDGIVSHPPTHLYTFKP